MTCLGDTTAALTPNSATDRIEKRHQNTWVIPIARSEFMNSPPPLGSPRFARGTARGAPTRFPLLAGGTLRRGSSTAVFCELWLGDWYYFPPPLKCRGAMERSAGIDFLLRCLISLYILRVLCEPLANLRYILLAARDRPEEILDSA